MADSKEPGKKGSAGSVIINVEKGKTTTDDFNAWFESLYTGYEYISPDSNAAGNEQVNVRIYDITEEQIAAYIQKIEEHGYAHLIGDSYSKKTDFGTSMIKISKYLDDGYIIVYIDPSI